MLAPGTFRVELTLNDEKNFLISDNVPGAETPYPLNFTYSVSRLNLYLPLICLQNQFYADLMSKFVDNCGKVKVKPRNLRLATFKNLLCGVTHFAFGLEIIVMISFILGGLQ